ncbi:MAG: hypothetical protein ACLU6Y_20310 [Ruminococcus sp.]
MVKVVGTSTVDMIIKQKGNVLGKDSKAFLWFGRRFNYTWFSWRRRQSAFGDTYAWLKKVLMCLT